MFIFSVTEERCPKKSLGNGESTHKWNGKEKEKASLYKEYLLFTTQNSSHINNISHRHAESKIKLTMTKDIQIIDDSFRNDWNE